MSQADEHEQQSAAGALLERNIPEVLEARSDRYTVANAAILDAFHNAFKHSADQEEQQFIDVGCGVGDLTYKYLLPRCHPCRRLVAVDRSANLVEIAGRSYPHPKIEYMPLDIVGDVDGFVRAQGQFQRVYSFSMLHWVRDQRLAMQNFQKLMAPGGELFIVMLAGSLLHDMYKALIEQPQWTKYAQILEEWMPAINGPKDVESLRKYARDLLKFTDLIPLACEVFSYRAPERTKDEMISDFLMFKPIIPLVKEEQEMLREFVAEFTEKVWVDANEGRIVDRQMIVIHAEKPVN